MVGDLTDTSGWIKVKNKQRGNIILGKKKSESSVPTLSPTFLVMPSFCTTNYDPLTSLLQYPQSDGESLLRVCRRLQFIDTSLLLWYPTIHQERGASHCNPFFGDNNPEMGLFPKSAGACNQLSSLMQ